MMENDVKRSATKCFLAFIWLAILSLFGCREAELPSVPPEELVLNSAARMQSLDGFRFIIERTGAPVYLDTSDTIAFRRAEGYFAAPDRSQAVVRIITPVLVTDVNVISIGDTQWEANVLTGQWNQLPPNWGFNPSLLLDPEIGIQAILTSDLHNLEFVEYSRLEHANDKQLYLIEGSLDNVRISQLSYGLIGGGILEVRLWIVAESYELVRAEIVVSADDDNIEPTVWLVDFTEFGQIVEIEAPPGD